VWNLDAENDDASVEKGLQIGVECDAIEADLVGDVVAPKTNAAFSIKV